MSEIITFIPVIENRFDLDGAEVEVAYGRYLTLEKVRDIEFVVRHEVRSPNKNHHDYVWLGLRNTRKNYIDVK